MRKSVFVLCLFCCFLCGCSKSIRIDFITSHDYSWGQEIYGTQRHPDKSFTDYILMIPDSDIGEKPSFHIKHFPHNEEGKLIADSVQSVSNVQVGHITRINGQITSFVVNGVRYFKN